MSETGIEFTDDYVTLTNSRRVKRAEAGVHLLVWVLVYALALAVVALDVFYWRAG